jgi:CBS domain-containing protein
MNVKEVMSREIRTIRMVDRCDAAARVMWENDCGVVPVVDGNQTLVGIVTDRDLCMAGYTQGRSLGEIAVTQVMARGVATCRPDDPLATALATMQQRQVRRLPVIDARGVVVGMLASNDLTRLAAARPAAVDGATVLRALAAIAAPRRAAAQTTAAPQSAGTPGAASQTSSSPQGAAPQAGQPAGAGKLTPTHAPAVPPRAATDASSVVAAAVDKAASGGGSGVAAIPQPTPIPAPNAASGDKSKGKPGNKPKGKKG